MFCHKINLGPLLRSIPARGTFLGSVRALTGRYEIQIVKIRFSKVEGTQRFLNLSFSIGEVWF